MSGGGAFGSSKSSSSNQSTAQGTSEGMSESGQSVFGADAFSKLFSGASGAAAAGIANGDQLGTAARDLFTGGTNFLDSLSKNNSGQSYEQDRLSHPNAALDQQISALAGDENQFLTNTALPGIATNSIASGSLGNDRQGVAQGVAISAANKDFLSQAATLRANDVNQRDAVAANLAGQTLQGASTGLGSLPSLMDLLTNSSAPELGIYKNLAGVLGGPTTLTQQYSKSFSQNTAQSSGQASGKSINISGGGGVGYGV
jgi:hypothetical protein